MSKRSTSRVLPVDLVEEILLRLPVKYVLRCKLLSKTHQALLTSAGFATRHLMVHQSSTNNNNSILVPVVKITNGRRGYCNRMKSLVDSGVVEEVCVPPPANSAYLLTVAGSCNGLLCLLSRQRHDSSFRTFLLWNPATKDFAVLPAALSVKPPTALGFGYDVSTKDYKLVNIIRCCPSFRVELWNMSTNSWREIDFVSSVSFDLWVFKPHPGVLVKGSLYWLLVLSKNYDRPYRAAIVSFNLANDSFRAINIALPEPDDIMDFMGFLALSVVILNTDGRRSFDIWVMGDDFDKEYSWTKRFSIGPFPDHVRMTRVCVNGNFLMEDINNRRYFLYDPVNNKEEDQRQWQVPDCVLSFSPLSVTNSVVSVHGIMP